MTHFDGPATKDGRRAQDAAAQHLAELVDSIDVTLGDDCGPDWLPVRIAVASWRKAADRNAANRGVASGGT